MSVSSDVNVGITACLDAVINAFKDGGAIIEKIKKKRALKRAPAPPRLLEESIDQAPEEIEKEKQRGLNRFGKAFEDGDHIAVIVLQQITIQLQSSLLEKLRHAAFDDDTKITDFTYLVDAADLGRDRTIAALHEFKQRLINSSDPQGDDVVRQAQQSAQSISRPPPTGSASASTSGTATPAEPNRARASSSPKSSISQSRTPTKEPETEVDAAAGAQQDEPQQAQPEEESKPHHRKRSSLLHFLKHTRTHSKSDASIKENNGSSIFAQPIIEEPASRNNSTSPTNMPFRPPIERGMSAEDQNKQPNRPQQPPTKFRYEDWEDNPEEIWGSKPSLDRHQSMAIAPDQPSQNPSSNNLPLQPPSPVLTHRTNSNPHNPSISTTAIPMPNSENDFLGFCKGAVKLQNGDRKGAMHKCKEVEPWSRHPSSHASAAQYLACQQQRCAFRSSFANNNPNVIWQRVFTLESKGMKVRWQFLAKSHVLQKVVVKHQYSFKCLFCVFSGKGGGVYHGMDYYLDHINEEHRGRPLGDVILYKTGCIADHIAGDEEEFDINLYPGWGSGTGGGAWERGGKVSGESGNSRWLSDDLMDPTKDANDSMFSNEPWNEGLSDFHYSSGEQDYIT